MSDASTGRRRRVQPPQPRTTTATRRTASRSGTARRSTATSGRRTATRRTPAPRETTARRRPGARSPTRRPRKGTVHGADYLPLASGVVLLIAATAMGTWAVFSWLFLSLGFDRGTIMPLAILAVLSAAGGIWLLVWIQRVQPVRMTGFITVFAGVGLVLLSTGLAFLRRDWGPVMLLGAILVAAGLGVLLYSARHPVRRRR
jgi:hypothetical protein